MATVFYEFEWDPAKAETNVRKHGVPFERAAEVFLDPLALTIPDDAHSLMESRWVTIGKDRQGEYALVVHTYEEIEGHAGRIRIISARAPTRTEIRLYEADQ